MYATKEQDHEKRKNAEGSYSPYNYAYHYLLDNFEPEQLSASFACEQAEKLLFKEVKAYCNKCGKQMSDDEIMSNVRNAITNFYNNKGEHGDTANNLGKRQDNSFRNIVRSLQDLRW